jgi:Holliday junction resolvasome RuvABC endonuclease subunit
VDGDLSISSSGIIVEELDDNTLDVIDVKYYGFTTKKKLEQNNILYYNNKNFNNDYAKYTWMQENILNWFNKCFYVAIEDYAFGTSSSSGMIFSLAEFEGNIKIGLYNKGKKLRFYSVNSNKKFFTGYGLSDKIGMYQAFNKYTGVKPDISTLPIVDSGKGVAPTSDIIDAFALCECLRMELKLRAGLVQLHELPKHQIEVYNVITREHPQGLLVAPFIEK